MTEPTYKIEADAAGEFLKLTLTGDWNVDITERFGREVAATLGQMLATGTRHGHLRTLIDMRHKNVVPQTVAAEFGRMVRPDSPSKKIALLVSGALHRMQAKRLSDHRHRLFDTEAAARAWLFED
ncbi:hypothetical protein J2Y58_000931 [Sphingomonas sp. BE138]|uniref:hypothetical protein n=1 Tax=Sphingomonas sp. BE138 TaxID=2817845 RepID=UPI002858B217|nr:hypothetical protein [Sphingomonas sp. BE138]MDR6787590.1 hypothetical protein [Sphingomonas sp. BE138]